MKPSIFIRCVSLFSLTAFAPNRLQYVAPSEFCFQNGEELTYKVFYNLNFVWVPAGEATFRVTDAGTQFKLSAVGKSYSSYDWFFKVRDYYYTDVDKTTLLPSRSVRDVAEGGYKLYDAVTFDRQRQLAHFERGDSKDKIHKRGSLSIEQGIHDIVSVLYYTRSLNFNQMSMGASFPVKVMLDEQTYPLQVKYLGKEVKHIKDLGKYKTMKFSPQVVAGNVFKEGAQMKIWASDDGNKVPLMIESPVSVGSVKVVLKSYTGLKHPMTAKL